MVTVQGSTGQPKLWPSKWAVDVVDSQDRWTVGIPQNTLTKAQLGQFKKQNLTAPTGYQAQSPGNYLTILYTPPMLPDKKVTLKAKLLEGSDLKGLQLPPAVFGRGVGV